MPEKVNEWPGRRDRWDKYMDGNVWFFQMVEVLEMYSSEAVFRSVASKAAKNKGLIARITRQENNGVEGLYLKTEPRDE